MADYSAVADQFRSAGAEVAALSVDDEKRSEALRQQLNLKFPLLCDPGRAVVKAYDLLNAGEKGGIAYPAVFVIDRERVVRFAAREEVATRTDIKQLLELVHRISQGGEPVAKPRQRGLWPGEMFLRATMNALLRGIRVAQK